MFDIKDYLEAKSIKEAVNYLSENEDALVIAGGTDVLIKSRHRRKGYIEKKLVGITKIPKLKEIKEEDDSIFIGACVTFTEVEENDLVNKYIKVFSEACSKVGGPQIRNVGTVGGNLCNGVTSADSASTLFAYDAKLVIEGESSREVAIEDFYISHGKVDLKHNEILVGIKVKKQNLKGKYIKFAQRNAMDIATVGCCVLFEEKNGCFENLKIGLGVVSPIPIRAKKAECFGKGLEINEENINQIAKKTIEETKARDSWRASKEYRENLIFELVGDCIKEAK